MRKHHNPLVVCNDGFTMSVQANDGAYCKPREDYPDTPYTHVEIGSPSSKPVTLELLERAELFNTEDYTQTVYSYVPVEIVQKEIDAHQGLAEGCLPTHRYRAFLIETSDFKPNMLIQYKGGGYDGCFWEWNYAFIAPDSEFVNLGSTGSAGCDTLEELEESYENKKEGDFFLYDLNDKKALTEVPDEISVDHLIGVAGKLKEAGHPVDFQPQCCKCETRFSVEFASPHNLVGIGGIALAHQDILCEDCAVDNWEETESDDGHRELYEEDE